jgi:RNA polymerase subunit RPABC4/transcription elongation factor Spt4
MYGTISRGLDLLATGLRPYVAARVASVRFDARERGDAQFLLVFMWDRWNDLFRDELSFVERSLISELRDFRNRWAHQDHLTEQDTYRVLDDIERLLHAINSDITPCACELRRESLNRLWQAEVGPNGRNRAFRVALPYLLCLTCAAAISVSFFQFFLSPWNGILSLLVLLGMIRLAWHQSQRESVSLAGPKECGRCGKIIYTIECPYCNSRELLAGSGPGFVLSLPSDKTSHASDFTDSDARRRLSVESKTSAK